MIGSKEKFVKANPVHKITRKGKEKPSCEMTSESPTVSDDLGGERREEVPRVFLCSICSGLLEKRGFITGSSRAFVVDEGGGEGMLCYLCLGVFEESKTGIVEQIKQHVSRLSYGTTLCT